MFFREKFSKFRSRFFKNFRRKDSYLNYSSSATITEGFQEKTAKIGKEGESIVEEKDRDIEYSTGPGVFYLKNHVDDFLTSLLEDFRDRKYFPRIGLEIEFYAPMVDGLETLASVVGDFSKSSNIDLRNTTKEVGNGQFEIDLNPYTDIHKLIDDFEVLKNFLEGESFGALFEALPFYGQPFSALQINISIGDSHGKNLFAKNSNEESELLLNSVAGILETTNSFLPLYLKSTKNLLRFDLEFNKIIYSRNRNPAPTYNSWGINNRSCSIRIPTPKNFRSKDEYLLDCEIGRRIEFRVPTADCDIKCAIFCVLYSVLYGIANNLKPIEATSNNVLEHHDGYRKIAIEDNICDFLM